jgi:hypothetical protein
MENQIAENKRVTEKLITNYENGTLHKEVRTVENVIATMEDVLKRISELEKEISYLPMVQELNYLKRGLQSFQEIQKQPSNK